MSFYLFFLIKVPIYLTIIKNTFESEAISLLTALCIRALETDNPLLIMLGGFSWKDSDKGYEFWAEKTQLFLDQHPMLQDKPKEESGFKCNKCGSTNVSVSSFGDRTGVNCRDCGKSRLLVD